MAENKYYVVVSDRSTGRFQSYIRDEFNKRVSPEFDNLATLIPWMRLNDFNWDEYDHSGNNFDPWRVCKGTPRNNRTR